MSEAQNIVEKTQSCYLEQIRETEDGRMRGNSPQQNKKTYFSYFIPRIRFFFPLYEIHRQLPIFYKPQIVYLWNLSKAENLLLLHSH